jgi:L-threonylcarbamoyladenylate synthase
MERFCPGPLTLILKTNSGEKIGIRMPRNNFALEFISACGAPIAATSANISGNKPPCNAEDVLRDLDGKIDLLLDGGETKVGIESTVIDVSAFPYKILREGAISKGQIADVGRELQHVFTAS